VAHSDAAMEVVRDGSSLFSSIAWLRPFPPSTHLQISCNKLGPYQNQNPSQRPRKSVQ
jgi:hypothetical protein